LLFRHAFEPQWSRRYGPYLKIVIPGHPNQRKARTGQRIAAENSQPASPSARIWRAKSVQRLPRHSQGEIRRAFLAGSVVSTSAIDSRRCPNEHEVVGRVSEKVPLDLSWMDTSGS